jgi:hypothetical protein
LIKAIGGGKNYYDIFAFHGHGPFPSYESNIKNLSRIRASLDDKTSWWANETAVSSTQVGDIVQAETLFQKFLYSWANGAIGYNWYNLRNKGSSPENNEHNFGLLTKDFQPKPTYVTYNMLARYYREGEFIRSVDAGEGLYIYLFRRKTGDILVANWNGSNMIAADNRPVAISGVTGQAFIVDIWGNETPVKTNNGVLILPVSRRPSTLRITGQKTMPSVDGEPIRIKENLYLHPGADGKLVMAFDNKNGIEFDLKIEAPVGIRIEPDALRLGAGEKRDVIFNIKTGNRIFSTEEQNALLAKFHLDIKNLWTGTLDYKIRTVTPIFSSNFTGKPTFVLDNRNQVTSLVVNEPSTAHLFWKGPQDLGAKIGLSKSGDALLLNIIVSDDVHPPSHTGTDIWLKDRVSIGLNIPGQHPLWIINFAHLADNTPKIHIAMLPSGYSPETVVARISLKTGRDETLKQTVYQTLIPLNAIGLTHDIATQGFEFNIGIHDNDDGSNRAESYMSLVPGDMHNKMAKDVWPVLILL